jgi:hypothetical protein
MVHSLKTLAVAALALPLLVVGASAQQNVDTIRAQCITEATAAYPSSDPARDNLGNARALMYINCMRKHGLQP